MKERDALTCEPLCAEAARVDDRDFKAQRVSEEQEKEKNALTYSIQSNPSSRRSFGTTASGSQEQTSGRKFGLGK
jgi:hypothetical protein